MQTIRFLTQLLLALALTIGVVFAAHGEEKAPEPAPEPVPMETIAKIYYQKGVMQALYFVAHKCEGAETKAVDLPVPNGKVRIHCRTPGI